MTNGSITSNIASAIRRRRSELGLSLDDVAKRAGCTKSHVWELEQGRSKNPTVGLSLALCEALAMPLNELLGMDVSQPRFTENEMALIAAHRAIFNPDS